MKNIAFGLLLLSWSASADGFLASRRTAAEFVRAAVAPEKVLAMLPRVQALAKTMRAAAQTTQARFESTPRPQWHLLTDEQYEAMVEFESWQNRAVDDLLKPLSDELLQEIDSGSPSRDRLRELYTALWFAAAQLQKLTHEDPWLHSAPLGHRRRIAYWNERADLIDKRCAAYDYAQTFSDTEIEKFAKVQKRSIEKQLRFVSPSTVFKYTTEVSASIFYRFFRWIGGDVGLGFGPTY